MFIVYLKLTILSNILKNSHYEGKRKLSMVEFLIIERLLYMIPFLFLTIKMCYKVST